MSNFLVLRQPRGGSRLAGGRGRGRSDGSGDQAVGRNNINDNSVPRRNFPVHNPGFSVQTVRAFVILKDDQLIIKCMEAGFESFLGVRSLANLTDGLKVVSRLCGILARG